MTHKIDFIVATTKKESLDFINSMNIKSNAIITNQHDQYSISKIENYTMITTPTKGVGINRNIGLNLTDAEYALIVDDDMLFYDNAVDIINSAIEQLSSADVIIFNFDYTKSGKKMRTRIPKTIKLNYTNCLKYGICCALVKVGQIRKKNISFSTLFGGGCKYGSGEDSLFYLDCLKNGLTIYTYNVSIGANEYRESTWFNGYNEKFFYDKGALFAAIFKKFGHFLCCLVLLKNKKLLFGNSINYKKAVSLAKAGAKGFYNGITYEKWISGDN